MQIPTISILQRVKYWLDKEEGVFGVTGTGDIVLLKPLDYETRDVYVFRVHVTDGRVVSMQN